MLLPRLHDDDDDDDDDHVLSYINRISQNKNIL